jgi:hypothetical protein
MQRASGCMTFAARPPKRAIARGTRPAVGHATGCGERTFLAGEERGTGTRQRSIWQPRELPPKSGYTVPRQFAFPRVSSSHAHARRPLRHSTALASTRQHSHRRCHVIGSWV